jgi:hypothetical protein
MSSSSFAKPLQHRQVGSAQILCSRCTRQLIERPFR